jgi:hypothetical protein
VGEGGHIRLVNNRMALAGATKWWADFKSRLLNHFKVREVELLSTYEQR